jgi:16S rRNA processing protein RimM
VRGEVRVELLTDYPERLSLHSTLYLGPDFQPHRQESIRFHQEIALIKLEGCKGRDQAEALRGQTIYIPREEAAPLEGDEYFHFQLVGLVVVTDEGEALGKVIEILETGANDVYIIRGTRGEILLPAISEVVLDIDLESQRMTVNIPLGLLDDG